MNINAKIGIALSNMRASSGLSLSDLALELGRLETDLAAMEHGQAVISAADLYHFSLFYRCNPACFFEELEGFAPTAAAKSETDVLMQNFLLLDEPNRGQLFSDFLEHLYAEERKNES